MTNPILAKAQALKEEAEAERNSGDLQGALQFIDEAIELLETQQLEGAQTDADTREIRAELADTYGMRGGTFRRIGDLDKALAAYTTGAEIETSDDLSATYNRSNVIALNVTAKGLNPTDQAISKPLKSIIERLKVDTADERRDEWWAWADLAQFYLLNGEPDRARECYADAFSLTGPSGEQIRRHATILQELAEKTADTAPTIAANIRAAIATLPR